MTMVVWSYMLQTVSKSQFKPRALEYLRKVEKSKKPILITHFGKPVAKIVPYDDGVENELIFLRDSIISYDNPLEPVADDDWEALK